MSLLVLAGDRCSSLMDEKMRNIHARYIQCDELWTFVAKKKKNVRADDPAEFGDVWIFVALDVATQS